MLEGFEVGDPDVGDIARRIKAKGFERNHPLDMAESFVGNVRTGHLEILQVALSLELSEDVIDVAIPSRMLRSWIHAEQGDQFDVLKVLITEPSSKVRWCPRFGLEPDESPVPNLPVVPEI